MNEIVASAFAEFPADVVPILECPSCGRALFMAPAFVLVPNDGLHSGLVLGARCRRR